MSSPANDRNLLFGILALQADFITQPQFVEVCALWSTRKETPLAELLIERGWLSSEDRNDVEKLLERKLKKNHGDVQASIVELTTDQIVRSLAEAEGTATVTRVQASPEERDRIQLSTTAYTPEAGERYTITRLHATGGIGQVWLARDEALGRDVALKEIRPDRTSSESVWSRFVKEARITGQLEHPGIIPIYELGKHPRDDRPFYTMRFIKGRTFRDAILVYHQKRERNEPHALELQTLLNAFVSICNAVAYAHTRGIIHRDLKPANIVLGNFGEVMVLDWGLAKIVGEDSSPEPVTPLPEELHDEPNSRTMHGQVLGTPAYMAPEQAKGEINLIDARTDVYGLGAILFELLTGRPPFTGPTVQEVLTRVSHLQPDRPRDLVKDVPRPLEAICLKCLEKDQVQRYQDARFIADEINHFLADEPVTAWREPFSARVRRWSRRHRTFVASGVVALLVAVPILIAGILLLNQSEQRERFARQSAQASYRRALNSADAMAEELARGIRPILGTQRQTVLSILDRANRIYEELIGDPNRSVEAMASQARTLILFSELYRETGKTPPALRAATAAFTLYDRLLQDDPENRTFKIDRAKARHRKAWVLLDQGHDRQAIEEFQTCIAELLQAGAEDDPRVSAILLGSAYTFLANELLFTGDHEGAQVAYLRGLDLRQKAAVTDPKEVEIQLGLAISLEKWGRYQLDYADHDKGLSLIQQAVNVDEALTTTDPWNSELHLHLVRILNTLAQSSSDKQAIAEYLSKSEKIIERFATRDPSHTIWQRERIRYRFIKKKLETRQLPIGSDLRKGDIEAQIALMKELVQVLDHIVREDPENYYSLADVANFRGRIAERYLDLTLLGGDEAELCRQARTHLEIALRLSKMLVKRSPESVEWQQLLIWTRYQEARLLQIEKKFPQTMITRWNCFRDELEFYRDLMKRFPNVEAWPKEIRRTLLGMGINFASRANDAQWDQARRDPKAVEALVELARQLDSMPTNLPEMTRKLWEPQRREMAKHLEEINAVKPLSEAVRKLAERLKIAP